MRLRNSRKTAVFLRFFPAAVIATRVAEVLAAEDDECLCWRAELDVPTWLLAQCVREYRCQWPELVSGASGAGRTLISRITTRNEYLERKTPMPGTAGSRPVQMTIHADDVATAVAFYSQVLGAEFIEPISSFQFGAWNTGSFFLLTIEPQNSGSQNYPGRNACLGFEVDDLDSAYQRALAAGGTEVHPPREFEWKPRTALVDDPSGNRLALTQRRPTPVPTLTKTPGNLRTTGCSPPGA